jgi:hypothetical protein
MPDQVEAFATVEDVRPTVEHWTCTKCGNDNQARLRVDGARPSLDERYALGYCDDCTPTRKTVKGPTREHVPLIRSRLFDRERHVEIARARAEAKLLLRYRNGHLMTEDEIAEVQVILKRQERE